MKLAFLFLISLLERFCPCYKLERSGIYEKKFLELSPCFCFCFISSSEGQTNVCTNLDLFANFDKVGNLFDNLDKVANLGKFDTLDKLDTLDKFDTLDQISNLDKFADLYKLSFGHVR